MALELRILTGARAGQQEVFEKSVIAIGRHPLSDLRFDAERDLDVSTKHAEIRGVNGRYSLRDANSTNGTFVNGERLTGEHTLRGGDRISFGAHGPEVEVHLVAAAPAATRISGGSAAPAAGGTARRPTTERIAIAVNEQTSKIQRTLLLAVALLGAGIAVAYILGHRQSVAQVQQLQKALAQNDSTNATINAKLGSLADTGLLSEVARRNEALRAQIAHPGNSAKTIDSLRAALESQRAIGAMDTPGINDRDAPAVAMLVAEIGGKNFAGTAFAVTSDGMLVTNRHVVQGLDGTHATRLAIKFRDSNAWRHAHVVKVSADSDVDLAIVQMDEGAPFPVVAGISADDADVREGSPVVTIGFPHAMDLPMEGSGNDFVAKTSLDPGTISKRVSKVLQIDSYATHGSSGSPVFDAHGIVVGVVYAGAAGTDGRIVLAVPSQQLAAFLPIEARLILK